MMGRLGVLLGLLLSATASAQVVNRPITTDTLRTWIRTFQPRLLDTDTSNVVVFFVNPDGRVTRSEVAQDADQPERSARAQAMRQLFRERGNPVVFGPDSLLPVERPFVRTNRVNPLEALRIEPSTMSGIQVRANALPEWPHEVIVIFLK